MELLCQGTSSLGPGFLSTVYPRYYAQPEPELGFGKLTSPSDVNCLGFPSNLFIQSWSGVLLRNLGALFSCVPFLVCL